MNTRAPSRAPRTERRIQGKKRSGNGVVRDRKRELKRDVEIMERGFADHLKSMSEEVGASDEKDTEDDEDDKDDGDDKVDDEEEAAEENDKDDEEEEEKAEENDKDKEDHVHHPSGDENKDTLSWKRKRDDEDDGGVSSGEEIFEPPAVQTDSDSPVIGPPPATSVSTSASIAVSAPLTKSVPQAAGSEPAPTTTSPPTDNIPSPAAPGTVQNGSVSTAINLPPAGSVPAGVDTPPALSVSKVVKAPPATGVSVPGVDKAPPTTGVSVPATVKAPPTTKPPTTKPPTTRQPTAGPPTMRPPVTKPLTTRPPTTGVSTIVKAPPTAPLPTPLIRPPIPPPPPKILIHFIRHTKAVQDYDRNNRTIIRPDPPLSTLRHNQAATIRNHFPRVGVTHIFTFPLKRTVETSLRIFFPLPRNSPKIQAQIVPALRPVPPPTLFNIPSHPTALSAMFSTGYHAQHRDAVDWSGLPAYPNHSTTLTSHARTPAMNRMLEVMCADAAREGRGLKVVIVGHGSSLEELFRMMSVDRLRSTESWRTFRFRGKGVWDLEEIRKRSSM